MKKLLVLLFALLSAHAFGQAYSSTVLQNSPGNYGRPVPFPQVVVCASSDNAVPCTNRAITYTDDTLTAQCLQNGSSGLLTGNPTSGTGCNNPGIGDVNGNFQLYLANGEYTLCTFSGTWQCQKFTLGGAGGGGSGNVNACGSNHCDAYYSTAATPAVFGDPFATDDGAGNKTARTFATTTVGTGTITLQNGSAPANPATGNSTIYTDNSGLLQCKNSVGGNCNPTAPAFSGISTGTNTSATMTVGSGASMGTSGTGTIQATGLPSAIVSTLPTNLPAHTVYEVTDGITTGDCTVGGGLQNSLCVWNGANWSPIGDGGGVSTLPGTVNLALSYNMSCATVYGTGASTTTSGTITSGSTSIALVSATGFAIGQNVFIVGAGASSGPFNALITNVVSNTITVNVATGTSVTNAAVYNYSAPAQTTTNGTVNSASTVIPVNSVTTFFANQGINIAGAGAASGTYIGTIQSVSIGGSSITVTPATSTTVSNAIVEHDESAAMNAAITALAAGQINGTLFTPAGICLFNGPLLRTGDANAIVPIPNVPYDVPGNFTGTNGPTLSITIQGATIPSWTNYLISASPGWMTIPTSVGTVFQTSGTSGNLIGANNPNEGDQFTAVHLTLHNLAFRVPDNPAITVVNAAHVIGLDIENALFDTLTNGAQGPASQPTHTNGQAIVVPLPANDGQNQLLNIRVNGFYTATTWGEHSIGNHLTLYGNWQGIVCQDHTGPPTGAHRSWAGYVDIAATPYAIVGGASACFVYIEAFDPELNLVPSWANTATNRAMIYDPNNTLTGYVGVVNRKWFTRYGGQNIEVKYRDTAPNASGNLTWVPGFVGVYSPVTTSQALAATVSAICDRQVMEINLPISPTGPVGSGCVSTGVNFTGATISFRLPNTLQANANQYTLFELGNDQNNVLEVYVNNGSIVFKKRIAGTFTTLATGTYNPTTMLWWQLVESSGAVTLNTSPDGINWTNFNTCAATCVSWAYTSTNIAIEADCLSSCPTYPGYAKFDNFSINLASPTYARQIVTDGLFGSSAFGEASACETNFGITTLSTVATTTNTGQNCLPANAIIDAVVYRITTTITTAANFTIGDSTTAARFCSTQSTLTAGTTGVCFVQADQTGAAGPRQTSATSVRVTTNVNPGAGAIRLIVYYHTWTAPTS